MPQLFGNTHQPIKRRAQKLERFIDMATIVGIVGLGLAMVIGLLTANGNVTW